MSTDAAPAPVAAPAAAQPTPGATAAPGTTAETQIEITSSTGDGLPMDAASIDAFFKGEKPLTVTKEHAAPSEPAEPVAPITPVTETKPPVEPAGATPPADNKAPVTEPGDEERILPGKIPTRQFDTEGQRAMALQYTLNGNGEKRPGDPGFVTLREALGKLETHDTAAAATPAAKPEPSKVEITRAKVTTLTEKLATLRTERDAMAEDEKFYTSDVNAKTTEIEDAIRELSKTESTLERETEAEAGRTAAQQQQAQSAEKTAREKALESAAAEFPGLRDPKTKIGAEAERIYKELAVPGHPDHALLHAVNAAGIIGTQAARNLAKEMSKDGKISYAAAYESLTKQPDKPAAAATPAVPENPLQPKVLPVSGGATSEPAAGGQPNALTEEKLLEMAMDPKQLGKVDDLLYPRKSGWVIGGA